MAWIEVLLTKMFIEEGASDVDGFKALEKSFSHQHRGQQSHSHFMRPLCQSSTRAARIPQAPADPLEEQGPPRIVINGTDSKGSPKPASRSSTFREDSNDFFKSHGKEQDKGGHKDKGKKPHAKGNKSPKLNDTPSKDKDTPRKSCQDTLAPDFHYYTVSNSSWDNSEISMFESLGTFKRFRKIFIFQ